MNTFDNFIAKAAALLVSFVLGWAETKKKEGEYPQWVKDILRLAEISDMQHVVRNALVAVRSDKPVPMGLLAGAVIPHQITKLNLAKPDCRMKNWVEVIVTGMCQFGWIVAVPNAVQYKKGDNPNAKATGIGFTLGTLKVDAEDPQVKVLNMPEYSPTYTSRTLGTIWAKDGKELDHCAETFSLSNSIPLQWNTPVLHAMGDAFYLSEAKEEDWDQTQFDTFEEYCQHRIEQFNSYISKIPTRILEEEEGTIVYNTYAPDSRGRGYPTNDAYNYVGIKQIRALVRFAKGEVVSKDVSEFFEDWK